MPKITDDIMDYTKDIEEIKYNMEDIKKIVNYLEENSIKEELDDTYIMLSKEELNSTYENCIDFVYDNILKATS